MTLTHTPLFQRLLALDALGEDDSLQLLQQLTDPDVDPHRKAAMLALMEARGVTAQEVRGVARGLLAACRPVATDQPIVVDTCGTGGDGAHSLNLSTATALLVAALGLPVAKHGNRSVSSRSGSADVLEALGLRIADSPEQALEQLRAGFSFLYAPAFHPAMKQVAPVRRALGVRTVFNLVGPLVNPARPTHQLLGAYSEPAAELLAEASRKLGAQRVFVVHGAPHWDEATPMGPFVCFDVYEGRMQRRVLDPLDYGIPRCEAAALAGGDAAYNARRMAQVLAGDDRGPHEDAVVLNAALVLQLVGRQRDPRDAARHARAALHDGRAARLLEALR